MLLAQQAPIKCSTAELLAWQCEFRYNELVGIKGGQNGNADENANDPNLFVADIFLAATFFIGTIAFLWIVISWLKFVIQWWTDAKAAADAGKGIKYSLMGLAIVIFSYTIIRLIQYFVAWRI